MAMSIASVRAFQQVPLPQSSGLSGHDSITVVEHSSPEEIEEGKLNDIYEATAQLQRKGPCTPEIVQRYQSEVIPAVRKATFNVPKNKFLFLVNRDIGNCYLRQQKFAEAEASFQEVLQYAPIWQGSDDSAYPINFREIAAAQMGQQRWAAAEQSLLKSIALFDPLISAAEKSDAIFTLNYRGSQTRNYGLLAVVYFRESRVQDALRAIEKAYDDVTKYSLDQQSRNEVESIGKAIANASGDSKAQELWSRRGLAN